VTLANDASRASVCAHAAESRPDTCRETGYLDSISYSRPGYERRPLPSLTPEAFAPAHTVLEIAPGGGWYTDILAPHLHDGGHLVEAQ
jgi:hypothetical protein